MSTWIRIASIASVVLLHIVLMPTLFPSISVPIALVTTSVVWTALLGFPAVLPPLLTAIIICDSILFGSVQFGSLYFVGVSYSVSFFMKRTLLGERSGLGSAVLAIFTGGAVIGYPIFAWLSTGMPTENPIPANMLSDFFLAIFFFIVLIPVLRWFESMIRTLRQDAQFSIK